MLTEIENWYTALQQAIPVQALLGIKQSGACKARLVKQGLKEDRTSVDESNFNYYNNVLRVPNSSHTNNIPSATGSNVQNAFLHSRPYSDDMGKYPSYQEKTKPFEPIFQDLKHYANDVGMKTATSTSKRCYCKTATSTNKRHYRDQTALHAA